MKNILSSLNIELFEALEIGLAINDLDGNLLYVNKAYSNLIGYTQAEVAELSYWEITPKKYTSMEEKQLELLESQKAYGPYDKEYIHKNGSLIPVRLNGKVIEIAGKSYIWSTVEDVSFSKSKEISANLESTADLIEKAVTEIFILDFANFKFLYVNEAARENIGYLMSELTSLTLEDVGHELRGEKFSQSIATLKTHEVDQLEIESKIVRKDGTKYDSVIKLKIASYQGKPCYVAYINDVTTIKSIERKRNEALVELDKSLQFQKVIQQGAAYAIIATTVDGIINSFNPAAERLLGYKQEDLIGKETPALFHDLEEVVERSEKYGKIINESIEPGFKTFKCLTDARIPNEDEWTYINKSGKRIPVLLSITALKDSKSVTTGYLGIAKDITERKLKEVALQNAIEEAERALEIKSEFLANMSHEVRTPMNGILGMTSLLMNDVKDKEVLEGLEIINKSALSLLGIINDILDLSKIESGKFKINPIHFSFKNLISDRIKVNKAALSGKSIKLESSYNRDVPDEIYADELRLEQVINNLLSNAIKFTFSGEIRITVDIEKGTDSKNYIICSVEDSGIGISKDQQENIFDSFTQADSTTTRRFGGTGLGLAITRNLVELMGGSIWLESTEGEGSLFTFKVPVEVSSQAKIRKNETKGLPYEATPIKTLVVEDNLVNQKVVCRLLSKLGITAEVAANGQECLEALRKQKFDLVLMDCHMPVLDGFEATRAILKEYKEDRPYIIAVTASAMSEDVARCHEVGMDSFVSKPVSINSIREALVKFKKSLK
ncbi:PAS domain S-box protein [Halobacteriovorax sp. JY17]|uniref:PAS domain-containing hybrid sensor histidine kinase/response regulator n=1 Tax=Halobacteriovorax sp. JY17 TaxID=2014617 RepID=UPI000C4311A7|nr:PAS domain S-box protein [Halobacteriovorax sp. JY17]PIK14857.1 MAG: hypothetical protein CES88_11020 [Halobacteriovorax sp. JY17]